MLAAFLISHPYRRSRAYKVPYSIPNSLAHPATLMDFPNAFNGLFLVFTGDAIMSFGDHPSFSLILIVLTFMPVSSAQAGSGITLPAADIMVDWRVLRICCTRVAHRTLPGS